MLGHGGFFRAHKGRWAGVAAVLVVLLAALSAHGAGENPPVGAAAGGQPAAALPTTPPAKIDSGDTAWMLMSAALVMVMVPGLALFYGGMVRRKNVLATMLHSIAALGIVGVEWVVLGYAMSFGKTHGGVIGWDTGKMLLWNVAPTDVHEGTNIPEYVYMMFQGMFAIITPALIAGAFAERVKFSTYAIFCLLWGVLVYNPVCHWMWGGGWMGPAAAGDKALHLGAYDFAGGIVVHVTAGVSALVTALYLGKRIGYPASVLQPNSLVLTLLGAGLLWFGWFGFNGGSALGSNASASLAFTNTQIAAAGGAVAWLVAEWMRHGKPTSLGVASGLVAGLATITPAAGYVPPAAALLIGCAAGVICFQAVMMKAKFGYDDSLDAFGVHGIGGFLGSVCVGIFARAAYSGVSVGEKAAFNGAIAGNTRQLMAQIEAAGIVAVFAALGTLVICVGLEKTIGFRAKKVDEIEGLDVGLHGEQGWMLESMPTPSVELAGDQSVDVRQAREKMPLG
jgi:ammonium transporter, Amt family